MQPALTPGQAATLRLDTIERMAKGLTRAQLEALVAARDDGGAVYATRGIRGRMGGAHRRMCERMVSMGLLSSSPPFPISRFGIKVLEAKLSG